MIGDGVMRSMFNLKRSEHGALLFLLVPVLGSIPHPGFAQERVDKPPGSSDRSSLPSDSPLTWAKEVVWYDLVVSRFSNGDPKNDQLPNATAPPKTLRGPGDLQGAREMFPYLKALGINTLLISEVFAIREDVDPPMLDLEHVRADVGTTPKNSDPTGESNEIDLPEPARHDRALMDFLDAAHQTDFRVVLTLPLSQAYLPVEPSEAAAFLVKACSRWMKQGNQGGGVDGWLVQSPERLPQEAWSKWCAAMRDLNRRALLMVDAEREADSWISLELFDTGVDRKTPELIRRYLGRRDASLSCAQFKEQLLASTSVPLQRTTLRPLGSAGTNRLFNELSIVPTRASETSDKLVLSSNDKIGLARWRLAVTMQFFLPGAPVIFQGDEAALPATPKHGVVPPIAWHDGGRGIWIPAGDLDDKLSLSKWLIERRAIHAALRDGAFQWILCRDEDRVLAFSRERPGEKVILVIHDGDAPVDVILSAARPGQMVGVLTPHFQSVAPVRPPKDDGGKRAPPPIKPLQLAGSRQFADSDGHIRLRMEPMSATVVVIHDEAPK